LRGEIENEWGEIEKDASSEEVRTNMEQADERLCYLLLDQLFTNNPDQILKEKINDKKITPYWKSQGYGGYDPADYRCVMFYVKLWFSHAYEILFNSPNMALCHRGIVKSLI
jgi:hypothetical protein